MHVSIDITFSARKVRKVIFWKKSKLSQQREKEVQSPTILQLHTKSQA